MKLPPQGICQAIIVFATACWAIGLPTSVATAKTTGYQAELADPAAEPVYVLRSTAFRCEGTSCTAAAGGGSTRATCARLARKAGRVMSFSYNGRPLDAAALEKCND